MNEAETKVVGEFEALKEDLSRWAEFVDATIVRILHENAVPIEIPPKYRLKDNQSYLFKALYRRKPYADPINDIEDKVGTRVVLLNSNYVQEASKLLADSNAWRAVVTKGFSAEISEKPKIFDYQSIHIVVRPNGDAGFAKPELLSCEIQIRSLLQHAFAQTSHDSTYKGPYKNDPEILRHLSKSMALMEATDDYFCTIINLMSDPQRHDAHYMAELGRVFGEICPKLAGTRGDAAIAEEILSLLIQKPVEIGVIEAWVEKEKVRLESIMCEEKSAFTIQPIFLLVDYYFRNNPRFLNDNWPLNNASLRTVYSVEGVAYRP